MNLIKGLTLHHHAGCGYRAVILGTDDPVAVSGSVSLLLHKAVSRNAAEANDYSCMLHGIILIIEPRSYSSHIRSHTVSQKLLQTVRADDLRIIVEKKQIVTLSMSSSEIIDGRIVENTIPVHHMGFRIGCF